MPAYVIAEVKVTNPMGYEPYRLLAAESVARFGGRFLIRGGKADLIEGSPPRSASLSSNFSTPTPRDAGIFRRNTSKR
jgi:uncharacterized protein (DUF1330 family)